MRRTKRKEEPRIRTTEDWLKRRGEVDLRIENFGSLEEYRKVVPRNDEDG